MQIVNISLNDLKPYENNPRKNDQAVDKVAKSIEQFGFKVPLVIDKNNIIVAGHTRYKASKKLGLKEVPCIIADDLDSDQIKAFRIADNRVAEEAEWDFDLLQEELESLIGVFDLNELGFETEELDFLGDDKEIIEDDFEIELPEEPKAKPGDIYQLGNHRLMCGDSTKEEDVEKLMNGNKADISFTSPPYNASTTPSELKMGKTSKYENDEDNKTTEEYKQFLIDFTTNAINNSLYTFVNVQSLSNNKIALIEYMNELKNYYADTIIWDKVISQPAMAENVLNSEFEYVHIFSEKGNRVIGTKKFRGTLKNIIHIQRQSKNEFSDIHNATFSLEFAGYFVENFSTDSVLDLFGGTGSTLIACEQLNRICYMMEFDAKYVDVIIQRWENFTGKAAIKLN